MDINLVIQTLILVALIIAIYLYLFKEKPNKEEASNVSSEIKEEISSSIQ